MTKINCLLVEEQLMFADLLLPVLQSIPGLNLVVRAATGSEAIEKITFIKPELLLVDFSLPDFWQPKLRKHFISTNRKHVALRFQARPAASPALQAFNLSYMQ